MTNDRVRRSHAGAGVLSIALAAAVAGAGFYGGATDPLGRVLLAALCAILALLWLTAPRVVEGTRVRRLSLSVGALAALALLQTVRLPEGLAKALAPLAFASRDAYGGVDDGVRASLDVDATRRAGVLLLAFAVLLAAIGPRISARAAPILARCLALAALAHAAIALHVGPYGQREVVIFGGFEVTNPFQAYGSFPNRAQFAAFETVLAGASLWLLAGDRQPILDRALGLLSLTTAAAAVVASGSRGGVAGIVLAITAAWVLSPERGRRGRRALVVLALCATIFGARLLGVDALARAMPLRGDESARLDVWRGAVDLSMRQPAVGVGFDAFRYAYPGEGRKPDDRLVAVAENDVLQLAAEGGAVGLGLAAYGATIFLVGLRSRARITRPAARRRARLALAGPIGLLPLSMTSVPLHAPAVAIATIAAGTLVLALLREEADQPGPGYATSSESHSEVPWRAS